MPAAVSIGRVRGVPLRLHWSFLVVLPLFAYFMGRFYFADDAAVAWPGWIAFGWGALLAVFLFGTVLLHELGHSLTAKRFGLPVGGITLWPLGGISEMGQERADPGEELRYTVTGPLVNFVIGLPLVGLAWALAGGDLLPIRALPDWLAFLAWAGILNVFIGAFNLFLPAFPMDGGRVLRALLAKRMRFARATHIAANVGRGLAVLMAIAGFLIGSILLMAIGLFVWFGAGAEEQAARRREHAGGAS